MARYIMAIDQGTTSTRAMLFDQDGYLVTKAQKEFTQYFPANGWVEHDPEEIWRSTIRVCQEVILQIDSEVSYIAAIGITNQRETTVVWDKRTGKALGRAIVWQDRRTSDYCQHLKQQYPAINQWINQKTGLLMDPYFSATKIRWLLDNHEGAQALAEEGRLAFGTMDCFLLWRLTNGISHATDVTNASRTMLFNLSTLDWDQELLEFFDIPPSMLPRVWENCADFGIIDTKWFGAPIPITGMAGDQHAASFGQTCLEPGMVKGTYGTGCFVMVNTGEHIIQSNNHLLTTVMSKVNGRVQYALEGSIFTAGAAVKWLRDEMKMIKSSDETEAIARSIESNNGVYLVPAFTGLGAPHWHPEARAAIFGMTRDTGRAEIVRAVLEAVCYQTKDLLDAIEKDWGQSLKQIRVDGGMVANRWLLGFLSDTINMPVEKPTCIETTVRGAAYLAGLHVGLYASLPRLEELWTLDERFEPSISQQQRQNLYEGWQDAVSRIC